MSPEKIKTIADYQEKVAGTDIIDPRSPASKTYPYLMGLAGEVGEIITLLKKRTRKEKPSSAFGGGIIEESGDCLWYLTRFCESRGWTLAGAADFKNRQPLSALPVKEIQEFGEHLHYKMVSLVGQLAIYRDDTESKKTKKIIREILLCLAKICLEEEGEDFNFADVAGRNLEKTQARYGDVSKQENPLTDSDSGFEPWERFPRELKVEFRKIGPDRNVLTINDWRYGDVLTDNSHEQDGYRFHDIFHFTFMAVLHWSPVTRALLRMKRKSNPETDEVEDGARAILIEEGITHLAFRYGAEHEFLFAEGERIENEILKAIKVMVRGYEAEKIPLYLWEKALKKAFQIFRKMKDCGKGRIIIDMDERSIEFEPLQESEEK